jgi:pimeloyl-ACP methyl ester carboxylesterase
MALFMERERPQRYGFVRVFRPERYRDTATLVRLQAYSADRTPVVFIHGLQDTAITWVPMISVLLTDPAIRWHYQFWVFSYPSGYPFSYSAALLRKELDAVNEAFPDHKRIILVGHSMGGLVARLMVTDSGDRLWRAAFGASPETTRAAGRSRQLAEDSLIFHHRPEVQRVIFISTPHRGSEIASSWIGRLAAKFVQMPEFVRTMRDAVLAIASADRAALLLATSPNSINTLSPKHWLLRELNDLPITRGVPYHSIIGDRGRGDTPNSSDGVVAYSSSHLDGATSEAIVPSDHNAHRNPKGISETQRILKIAR